MLKWCQERRPRARQGTKAEKNNAVDAAYAEQKRQSSLEAQVERPQIDNMLRAGNDDACSPECQNANWPTHKVDCDLHVDFKAKKKMDSAADGG